MDSEIKFRMTLKGESMSPRKRMALELVCRYPLSVAAEMIGVKLSTLESWMESDNFKEAIAKHDREQQKSLTRLARTAAINAASSFCRLADDNSKADAKAMIDLLKLSNAFEIKDLEESFSIADVIKLAAKEGSANE